MSYLDKVCEFSGDYVSYEMYKHKRNHIQVLPEYQKHFKHKKAVLIVKEVELIVVNKGKVKYFFHYDGQQRKFFNSKHHRIVKLYNYALQVNDEELMGNVKGVYVNDTFELTSTIRRLKRLVGGIHYTKQTIENPHPLLEKSLALLEKRLDELLKDSK